MPNFNKPVLFLAVLAMSLDAFSGMAQSQAQDTDDGYKLEEIVVTARKIEERLQDTPVSVTAITAKMFDERGAEQITAVANIAPNMNFSSSGQISGSGSAAVVFIRGVGQNDFLHTNEPGVGIYVDGVYLGRTVGSVLDILDLERVEVIRGPQGTLFGRNTIGGAVSLHTKAPTEEWGGRLRAVVGEDDRHEFFGTVSGPISENIGVVASGMYRKRDGTVKRVLVGDELGDDDVLGGRIKFVVDVSDQLAATLSLDGVRERENSAAEVLIDSPDNSAWSNFFNRNIFGNFNPGSTDPAGCASGGELTNTACKNDQWVGAPYTSYETGPSHNDVDTWGITLNLDYGLNEYLSINSITAYRELEAHFTRGADGSPFRIFHTQDTLEQEQFSQELKLTGRFANDRLRWVAGAYYFSEEADGGALLDGLPPPFPLDNGGSSRSCDATGNFCARDDIVNATDNSNWAIYGEATLDLNERLHLTGGLRYTDESKEFIPGGYSLRFGTFTIPNVSQPEQNFKEVTWRASLAYDISDALNTYFTVSRGFKSGGYTLRLTQPSIDGLSPTFGPEFVTMYEIGLKAETQTLRVSLAGFYSDYEDIQVQRNVPPEINTVTANAAKGEIKGVEAELLWVPVSSLQVQGSLGYQDAEYTKMGEGVFPLTIDDKFTYTPEFSANLGVSYLLPVGSAGTLRPRLDWVHRSSIHFENDNDMYVFENGYDTLNLSAAFEPPGGNWTMTFGVNNVTDERYIVSGDSNVVLGYRLAVYARPRNWYLNMEYRF